MTVSRVFRGHIDRVKSGAIRTGGRQQVLVVMVDQDERAALEAVLPADLHRGQSIPIAFVVGASGEALLTVQAGHGTPDPAGAPPAPAPPEPDAPRDVFEQMLGVLHEIHEDLGRTNASTRSLARDVSLIATRLGT